MFCVQHARTDTAACMQGGHLKSPKISTSKGRGCTLTTDMSCCNIFGFSIVAKQSAAQPLYIAITTLGSRQGVQVIRAMPESKHSFPVDVFPKCLVWYGMEWISGEGETGWCL